LEQPSIAHLAGIFLDNTYGEYKKRLQFVELLLTLAWSDRELNHDEQDIILDIAAFLEIDNADFNALYESFEKLESSSDEALKAAKALEQLFSEQKEQDQASLQQVFFTHIQKLCANARKKDKPQATLLSTLLACEQAYIDTLQQLESSSKSRAPKASKSPKSDDKSRDELGSTHPESSSQHSADSTDSAPSTAPQNKPQTSVKKRDSSWDNI
ncbi:TerB family tellurite resistance protein, partial [Helicobacter sp.]|uniref:TerB family tellurite resistance protein n=1 Tax=Helicobacter sp. TaxID=218 RepID=UPI0038909693